VSVGSGDCGSAEVKVPRQEFFDSVDGVTGNASQDIGQVGFRIHAVQFCGPNQAVDLWAAPPEANMIV